MLKSVTQQDNISRQHAAVPCKFVEMNNVLSDLPRAAKKSVAKADVMICTPLPICTHSKTAFLGGRKTSPETIFQPLSSISLPASNMQAICGQIQ